MKLTREVLKNLIKEQMQKATVIIEEPSVDEGKGRGTAPGKFKRVMEILGPSNHSMKGFGIMSAENPLGQQSSPFDNERRMKQLMELLGSEGKEFEEVKGRFFNNDENSLVIPDVDIRSMAAYSSNQEWPQHSFIFGKKDKVGDDVHVYYYFVEMKYDDSYELAGYQITDHRTSIFKNAEIQQRADMFSQAGGKKFYIPFFDEATDIGGEEHMVPQGAPPNPVDPTEMK